MAWLALVLVSDGIGFIFAVEALTRTIANEISINQGHRIRASFYQGALYPRWYSRSKLVVLSAAGSYAVAAYRSESLLEVAASLVVAALVASLACPTIRSRLAPIYPALVARDLDRRGRHPLAFERIALGWLTAVRPDLRAALNEPIDGAVTTAPYGTEPITAV